MKRILSVSLAFMVTGFGINVASASPSSNMAWTVELKRLLADADPDNGKVLEARETDESFACTACHGKAGAEPDRDKYPVLAGQVALHTFKQLLDYKDEKRKHKKMYRAVADLPEEELADLAAWFAAQPPVPGRDADVEVTSDTLRLITKGDKKRLIQPCVSCHGSDGRGKGPDGPALAGQNAAYIEDTMKDFAREKRSNDIYGRMRAIAAALTSDEIEQLAAYYQGLNREAVARTD